MKFCKKTIMGRTDPVFTVLFVLYMILLFPVCYVSAEGLVTEQNIRDAIIGRKTFNNDQLKNQMDLNKDGKLDVADLVKYIKSVSPGTPVVGFELPNSKVSEGIGTSKVRVTFSEPFSGTLRYAITKGDAAPFSGSVQVKGITADIPVTVTNDLTITDGEMITVSLDSGTGYVIGAPREHLLSVLDNDAIWFGQIESNGMTIGFEMDILQNAASSKATVISDGTKGISKGEWAVDFVMTANTFYAKIGPITVPTGEVANSPLLKPFGTAFQRFLVLEASNGDTGMVQPGTRIDGNMTDTFFAENSKRSYLNTTVCGTFTLVKEIKGGGKIADEN